MLLKQKTKKTNKKKTHFKRSFEAITWSGPWWEICEYILF